MLLCWVLRIGIELGLLRTPADLLFQPLHPLVTPVSEMHSLGEKSLVLFASRLCGSCLSKGVLKVLAGEAHHERPAGSELL